ncbi:MAG: hypothetical protein LUQ26_04875 [Methylococcaceae bacterium]|nr:hypothetical protein [Methylococcaceae bacterium]
MSDESMSIVLNSGAPMLIFNFSLSEKNIAAFQNGVSSFGLFAEKDLLFFLFKIEGFLDWSDLAFTIHLAQDENIEDNGGYLPFNLVLVESSTSIIKALRMVTVSPTFRSVLAKAIEQQNDDPFNVIDYYNSIKVIYETYPEVVLMLKNALIVEQGGRTFKDS